MKTYKDFIKDEVIESKIYVTCIGAFDGCIEDILN